MLGKAPPLCLERYRYFCELRKAGVLEFVDPQRTDIQNGDVEILVNCSDPDRNGNMYDYHRSVCSHGGIHFRPMPLTLPGGSLLIHPESPLVRALQSEPEMACLARTMRLMIRKCIELKDAKRIALYAHFPCAAATLAAMSDDETLHQLVVAKDYLRDLYPGVEPRLYVHVDFTGYDEPISMCTFFFKRAAYRSFKPAR